jgi:DNA polymerase III sliding clamp (beta) subunit (PCNA family)
VVDTILESEPVWSVTIDAAELQNAVKHVRIINHETIQFKVTRYRDDRAAWGMSANVELCAASPEIGSATDELTVAWDVCPGTRVFDLTAEHLYDAATRSRRPCAAVR